MLVTREEAFAQAGLCSEEENYRCYFWCLLAADLGHREAENWLRGLRTAERVCAEDVQLAHFQLACWHIAGERAEPAERANEHLERVLIERGSSSVVLDESVALAQEQVRELIDLPERLDLTRPFGPASPSTPGNVDPTQLSGQTSEPLRRPWKPKLKESQFPADGEVQAIAARASGEVMTVDSHGEVRLWGETEHSFDKIDEACAIRLSPSGRHALLIGEGWPSLCDLERGEVALLKNHGQVGAWLNDHIFVTGNTATGRLTVGSVEDPTPIIKFSAGNAKYSTKFCVTALACAPEQGLLAVAVGSDDIRLLSSSTFELQGVCRYHQARVSDVAFSANGDRLLSGSLDGSVALWSVDTMKTLQVFKHDQRGLPQVSFWGNDHALTLSGFDTCEVTLWDLQTEKRSVITSGSFSGFTTVGATLLLGGPNGVEAHSLSPK